MEKHFSVGINGNAFGKTVAFAYQLPFLVIDKNVREERVFAFARYDRFGIVAPQPPHSLGEHGRPVCAIVSPRTPNMVYIIAGKSQRTFHRLVRLTPLVRVDVKVFLSSLHEYSERFRLILSDQKIITIRAAKAGIRSDSAEDPVKCLGMFPGRC